MQVVASVLQLQALCSQLQRNAATGPLSIVATINAPSTEDVLWHITLSYQAELPRQALLQQTVMKHSTDTGLTAPSPGVTLQLLNPDELMSGMLTQVGGCGCGCWCILGAGAGGQWHMRKCC